MMVSSCVLQLMALVASTLMDLVKNLRAFAGILVVSSPLVPVGSFRRSSCLHVGFGPAGGVLRVCGVRDLALRRRHQTSSWKQV